MTTQVQDDGFHEIQLNGKQLVFLFMAATVVSVVIFLCGVLVGRGVKGEHTFQATDGASDFVNPEAPQQPAAVPPTASATPPAVSVPNVPVTSEQASTKPPPVPDEEDFTYSKRLEERSQPEKLKPAPAPERTVAEARPRAAQPSPPPPAAPVAAPKPVAAAPKPVATPVATAGTAPGHDGYAIQVAALREPNEADTIAKRLVSKGYDAYVLTPPGGTPTVYRVRVGSFKTRRDAEATASKLQQEEQFKPWITR